MFSLTNISKYNYFIKKQIKIFEEYQEEEYNKDSLIDDIMTPNINIMFKKEL